MRARLTGRHYLDSRREASMIIGLGIFAILAIVVIYAFIKVKQRDREYERGE